MSNSHLLKAQKDRKDEFYTYYNDIKKECDRYLEYFKDKTIYCNCDCGKSEFVHYFFDLWRRGDIKRLIVSGIDYATGQSYYSDTDRPFDYIDNGDCFSDECRALLNESGIVVTNPPFSKSSEYFTMLSEANKDFLVIGNKAESVLKVLRQLFNQGRVRFGYNLINYFYTREQIEILGKTVNVGKKYGISGCWYTTLPVNRDIYIKSKGNT